MARNYIKKYKICVFILITFLVGCALPFVRLDLSEIEKQLYEEARLWKGTPYVHGGNGANGIDCSGFVFRVYEKLFGIRLPRDTSQQALIGVPIAKSQLRAGDLVFFSRYSKLNHVGIYLKNGEFVHASTSSGVIVSRLEDEYWQKTYRTSRRVLH
jgi:cell wall-associated NlpC family hydrolase